MKRNTYPKETQLQFSQDMVNLKEKQPNNMFERKLDAPIVLEKGTL
ncbi:19696_t:CDS:1, partial [Gigaspora rosea]